MNVPVLLLLLLALVLFVVAAFLGEPRRVQLIAVGLAALTAAELAGVLT